MAGDMMDKTIGISEFRKTIAEIVKDVHGNRNRYTVVQRSKARAVLISPDELEALEGPTGKGNPVVLKPTKVNTPQRRKTPYDEFFGRQHLDGKRSL